MIVTDGCHTHWTHSFMKLANKVKVIEDTEIITTYHSKEDNEGLST